MECEHLDSSPRFCPILTRVAGAGKRSSPRSRLFVRAGGALALAACVATALLLAGVGQGSHRQHRQSPVDAGALGGVRDSEIAQSFPESDSSTPHQLAQNPAEAAVRGSDSAESGVSPGAPSDAEVRRDLRQLQRYERRARSGGSVETGRRGLAKVPAAAPVAVTDLIAGGNAIATFPYRLGGGHGSFVDSAYDCSGSVSYALAAAGMVQAPLTSGELTKWGLAGPGRWITVYANPGHVFMTVGGLRFDTSGRAGRRGSRWQVGRRSFRGFAARHWPGL